MKLSKRDYLYFEKLLKKFDKNTSNEKNILYWKMDLQKQISLKALKFC